MFWEPEKTLLTNTMYHHALLHSAVKKVRRKKKGGERWPFFCEPSDSQDITREAAAKDITFQNAAYVTRHGLRILGRLTLSGGDCQSPLWKYSSHRKSVCRMGAKTGISHTHTQLLLHGSEWTGAMGNTLRLVHCKTLSNNFSNV